MRMVFWYQVIILGTIFATCDDGATENGNCIRTCIVLTKTLGSGRGTPFADTELEEPLHCPRYDIDRLPNN